MGILAKAFAALITALLLVAMAPLAAHTLSVAHLDIEVPAEGAPIVELDLALRDVALSVPIDSNRDDVITWGELVAARPALEALVLRQVHLSAAGLPCTLRPAGLATRRYDDGAYAALRMSAACPSNVDLQVRYDLFFDQDPQHRALVTVHRGDAVTTAILDADARRTAVSMTQGSPFVAYLREGVHHILIGYDHLAFLISLLLPAALIRIRQKWEPAPTLRTAFMHVLGIVTAFTVSHSITLTLAALGWVTPQSKWVEVVIAASVLLAALNNIRPLVHRRLWMVGFVFGLIHGFGFAGALGELGLPDNARLLALLGFNLGVELGQLAVVCLVLPLLYLLRNQRSYVRWVMPAASLAIAALAAFWMFERVIG